MTLRHLVPRRRKQFRRQLWVESLEDRVTPSVTTGIELDGNVDTASTHDWDQVFADRQTVPPGTTSGALASIFLTDLVDSRGDNIFTGGGSKDGEGIQDGPWLFTH